MSHFRHTVEAADVDRAVHEHLIDGKMVVPIATNFRRTDDNGLVATQFQLLVYDPSKFEKEKNQRIEARGNKLKIETPTQSVGDINSVGPLARAPMIPNQTKDTSA